MIAILRRDEGNVVAAFLLRRLGAPEVRPWLGRCIVATVLLRSQSALLLVEGFLGALRRIPNLLPVVSRIEHKVNGLFRLVLLVNVFLFDDTLETAWFFRGRWKVSPSREVSAIVSSCGYLVRCGWSG